LNYSRFLECIIRGVDIDASFTKALILLYQDILENHNLKVLYCGSIVNLNIN